MGPLIEVGVPLRVPVGIEDLTDLTGNEQQVLNALQIPTAMLMEYALAFLPAFCASLTSDRPDWFYEYVIDAFGDHLVMADLREDQQEYQSLLGSNADVLVELLLRLCAKLSEWLNPSQHPLSPDSFTLGRLGHNNSIVLANYGPGS